MTYIKGGWVSNTDVIISYIHNFGKTHQNWLLLMPKLILNHALVWLLMILVLILEWYALNHSIQKILDALLIKIRFNPKTRIPYVLFLTLSLLRTLGVQKLRRIARWLFTFVSWQFFFIYILSQHIIEVFLSSSIYCTLLMHPQDIFTFSNIFIHL